MNELKTLFDELKAELEPYIWNRFSTDNIYGCHLTAAFSRSFEFNLVANKEAENEDAYYFTPALRGICEDLIVLKFLKKHKKINADAVLNHLMTLQLVEVSEKQKNFFSKNHPQQIIFHFSGEEAAAKVGVSENELRDQWAAIGMKREKTFPSVSHMAVDSGMVEVYDYIYAATSDMVHFSPHILMRSGWSKEDDKFYHRFSMRNFFKYYSQFNRFYGGYLFVLFAETFKKQLALNKPIQKKVRQIKDLIYDEARWPELITFEEMNFDNAENIRMINVIRNIMRRVKKTE